MKRVARYHSSMRRRLATILSVMSLLLALATIAPQATIAPHDIKSFRLLSSTIGGFLHTSEAMPGFASIIRLPGHRTSPSGLNFNL